MNRKRSIIPHLLTITLLAFLLRACDPGKIKIGEVRMMYGSNQDGHISYTMRTFTGVEKGSIQAEKNQNIAIDFDIQVDKGTLVIEWQDPNGESIWQIEFTESVRDHEDIPVQTPGEYTILIYGRNAGGSFDVSWGIK